MGDSYRIQDQFGQYYITCTVHQWVDVFTRNDYVEILIESIIHCQKHKGLQVYAWVIMSNHIHLIISSTREPLSDILRDFKKFTASKIVKAIENNPRESRENWLLWLLKKDAQIIFWQDGYHAEEIFTQDFFDTKVSYIHLNPVRSGLVFKEEEYRYSSCCDYYGTAKSLIELSER